MKKAPATADKVIAMAAAGNGSLADLRDRALLLLGFGGAFRRRVTASRALVQVGAWLGEHFAKGLEFKAVAVMACDEDVIPSPARIADVSDEMELDEVYGTERQLTPIMLSLRNAACIHV